MGFNTLTLNCDLGEGNDDVDRQVMPYIDQANIACGGHAGDAHSMARCIELAQKHNVIVGAHPSYPDPEHFGRRSLALPLKQLSASLLKQVNHFAELCRKASTRMAYIKAHGALYHDAMQNAEYMQLLLSLANEFNCALMVQALPIMPSSLQDSDKAPLILEGFADRAYDTDGRLVSRQQAGAVHHSVERMVQQARDFAEHAKVKTSSGHYLSLTIDSLCVHGDTPLAMQALQAIRSLMNEKSG